MASTQLNGAGVQALKAQPNAIPWNFVSLISSPVSSHSVAAGRSEPKASSQHYASELLMLIEKTLYSADATLHKSCHQEGQFAVIIMMVANEIMNGHFIQTNERERQGEVRTESGLVCMGCRLNRCCWRASFECNRIHFIDFCIGSDG